MRLSCPSILPHQRNKDNRFAPPMAESQVRWQALQWEASVYNAPHLIVGNSNSVVTMDTPAFGLSTWDMYLGKTRLSSIAYENDRWTSGLSYSEYNFPPKWYDWWCCSPKDNWFAKREFIYSYVKADGNGARLPVWLDRSSAFIFPGDFVPAGSQYCIVKVRFRGKPSKCWWCHYSVAITLYNSFTL